MLILLTQPVGLLVPLMTAGLLRVFPLRAEYRAADALGAGPYPVTLQTFASPTPSVPGFNTAVNLTVISGTTPTVQFISYTPANVTATDVFTVASCPTVSVHVINTVLLPLAPAIALAALPTIISALPPLPAPPPPPPKSAASSFSNVVRPCCRQFAAAPTCFSIALSCTTSEEAENPHNSIIRPHRRSSRSSPSCRPLPSPGKTPASADKKLVAPPQA